MGGPPLHLVLSGAALFGMAAVACYFLRFWTKTRDGLFLAFAVAFAVMGVGKALSLLPPLASERTPAVYSARLVAFVIIIWALVRKNRAPQA